MKHLKRTVTALATAALVVWAILKVPESWLTPVFLVLMAAAMLEFFMLAAKKVSVLSLKGFWINLVGVMVLAFAFATLWTISASGRYLLLYVLAVVKLSDMGGFAFGVSFGKHKLCPSISPNKSWEGLLGSVFASVLMSFLFVFVFGVPALFPVWKTITVGLVAALIGTAGDLVESKFKRWVGVKDSGTFMPAGLGGLLDMFDSLLFAPMLILLICRW